MPPHYEWFYLFYINLSLQYLILKRNKFGDYKDVKFKRLSVRERILSTINWPMQEVWMNSYIHFIVMHTCVIPEILKLKARRGNKESKNWAAICNSLWSPLTHLNY